MFIVAPAEPVKRIAVAAAPNNSTETVVFAVAVIIISAKYLDVDTNGNIVAAAILLPFTSNRVPTSKAKVVFTA